MLRLESNPSATSTRCHDECQFCRGLIHSEFSREVMQAGIRASVVRGSVAAIVKYQMNRVMNPQPLQLYSTLLHNWQSGWRMEVEISFILLIFIDIVDDSRSKSGNKFA